METGRLVRWNSNKGFGFIEPDEGDRDVFIHISTLKHMARKPHVGDRIEYVIEQLADGKIKAVQAQIEGVAVRTQSNKDKQQTNQSHQGQKSIKKKGPIKMQKATTASGTMSRIIIILIVLAIGRLAYQAYYDITNASEAGASGADATIQEPRK